MRRFLFLTFSLALLASTTVFVAAAPFAYIPSVDVRNVSVIDTETNLVVATIAAGQAAANVAVNAQGTRVYVDGDGISVIDTATNTVSATMPLAGFLQGVAVNSAGTRLYVVNQAPSSVSVFDTATNTLVTTVVLGGRNPIGIDVNPAGTRAYVAHAGSSALSVIDTETNTEIAIVTVGREPVGVAVNRTGTRVYVANRGSGTVSVLDTATNAVVATVDVGGGPAGVAANPAGTRVYVTNQHGQHISVLDAVNLTVIATVPVGDTPTGIDVNPAGTRVYVANALSSNVSVIDALTNVVVATIAVGRTPIALGRFIAPGLAAPGSTSTVVEYHHASFDHYFITPVLQEIALLDAHAPPFQEWSRTGFSFNAYAPASAPGGSTAVCRFFNTSFAPKSSHFFAARGFGCEVTLALLPDWGLEDDRLFYAMLPDAASGACPGGTIPVYRLYNNGMGDAPNHRFVTSFAERQNMLDLGWVAEGAGIGVGMCVPQ
jgi:YVTN family beta-propeller protein